MPKKKKTIGKLKKDLWKVFSLYIRTRDKGICFTCGRKAEGSGYHAGHFVPKSIVPLSLYFCEKNTNGQCLTVESNVHMWGGGMKSIGDLSVGEEIVAFDEETFIKTKAEVQHIDLFVPNDLYEVELEDGSVFFATPGHKVVANGQWVTVEEMIDNPTDYDILEIV